MKSQKLRSVGELFVLLLGALLLSVRGAKDIAGALSAASNLPTTAYGAGELTGQIIGATCPLLIGLALVVIAYRHGFIDRAKAPRV